MAVYWNFREILGVFPDSPDFTCVGTTPEGARCGNGFLAKDDIESADRLLGTMDCCKSLKGCYQDLDELAYLTLCPRWHREESHSQVDQVSRRWRIVIAQYEKRLQDEVVQPSIRRANRQLAELKKTAMVLRDGQEEEKHEPLPSAPKRNVLKQRDANISIGSRTAAVKAPLHDPFTSDTKVTRAIKPSFGVFATSSPLLSEPKPSITNPVIPPLSLEQTKIERETKGNVLNCPQHDFSLPSPPEIPESPRVQIEREEGIHELPSTPTPSDRGNGIGRRSVTVMATTTTITTKTTSPINADTVVQGISNSSEIKLSGLVETPTKKSQIIARMETLVYQTEESFGYAIVTPEPARYKSYLPVQRKHGLITPPETPEALPDLKINTSTFNDSFPGFSVRPVVSRVPQLDSEKGKEHVVEACVECQDGACHCGKGIAEDDEEVRAGCFHRFGLSRLKKKVAGKMKALKTRITRTSYKRYKS